MNELGAVEFLPHTGDIGIRVRAASLEELFTLAAQALFEILADPPGAEGESLTDEVSVEAEQVDLLLRAWLDELLVRFLVDRKLYTSWSIRSVDDRRVVGQAAGVVFDLDRHVLKTELKAVTYHGLEVKRVGDEWIGTVIFDV